MVSSWKLKGSWRSDKGKVEELSTQVHRGNDDSRSILFQLLVFPAMKKQHNKATSRTE